MHRLKLQHKYFISILIRFQIKVYSQDLIAEKGLCTEKVVCLEVQLCKLYNMIASTQITNTEIFAFIAVLVCELLSRKVLFISGKDNRNC